MSIIRKIYMGWFWFEWMLWLFLMFPIYFILLMIKPLKIGGHYLNVYVWSKLIFWFGFIPVYRINYRENVKKRQNYVVCANHSSYIDIPLIFYTYRKNFTIIGKAELNKIPLFGYMFKNIYIAVDRQSRASKIKSYKESLQAIEKKSVVFFPEGTIGDEITYNLLEFQEGAFRLAIQKKTPILPVTMPNNWVILHDKGTKTGMRWKKAPVIFHEPIETKDMTLDDVDSLKDQVRNTIQAELDKWNKPRIK